MESLKPFLSSLDEQTKDFPGIKSLSSKTGLQPGVIALVLGGLLSFCMLSGLGAHIITDTIGIVYPAYMSFKAIESATGDDDKQWLSYWVVFALYRVLDDMAEVLFFWVPLYYPLKLVFLVFLFHPKTRGALKIYELAVKPIMIKHQASIDAGISMVSETAMKGAQAMKDEALKQGVSYIAGTHNS